MVSCFNQFPEKPPFLKSVEIYQVKEFPCEKVKLADKFNGCVKIIDYE